MFYILFRNVKFLIKLNVKKVGVEKFSVLIVWFGNVCVYLVRMSFLVCVM